MFRFKMTMAGVAAMLAIFVVTATAHAATLYGSAGSPGSFFGQLQNKCLERNLINRPNDTLVPYSATVGPSPRYGFPQTVAENVRIDYSVDGGLHWYPWHWLTTQYRNITSSSGASFFWTTGDPLTAGYSYRVGAELFYWYVGNTYVGGSTYVFDINDYFFESSGYGNITYINKTTSSAGCTSLTTPGYANF